jgi:translation initiation factor IF-3
LDLVEIAPLAKPPVAKIVDYNKFLYQQEKKKKEERKKAKVSQTKEVRLGPFTDDHDLQVSIKRAREFLTAGQKVKLVVKFSGRQIVHPEFGEKTLLKVIESVNDVSKVEKEKHFEGKQLISILSPEKQKKGKNEEESKEISQ